MNAASDQLLDTCGLTCPLPLLKAKQALNRLTPGATLEVVCTDPSSMRDFAAFAAQSGHTLLEQREEGDRYYHRLQKSA